MFLSKSTRGKRRGQRGIRTVRCQGNRGWRDCQVQRSVWPLSTFSLQTGFYPGTPLKHSSNGSNNHSAQWNSHSSVPVRGGTALVSTDQSTPHPTPCLPPPHKPVLSCSPPTSLVAASQEPLPLSASCLNAVNCSGLLLLPCGLIPHCYPQLSACQ